MDTCCLSPVWNTGRLAAMNIAACAGANALRATLPNGSVTEPFVLGMLPEPGGRGSSPLSLSARRFALKPASRRSLALPG
ncbi:MAG: hypothetical protein DBY37_11045 [Desulfovibrionaceae bacterium]|nr:MAG: hypothetical protein DBY37_15625 [Desulfovibrionaceae bacterium]PWL58761.1 MAG: hypothetical protein DBY37_11045 [Desulfovibrionaceae bacterium]